MGRRQWVLVAAAAVAFAATGNQQAEGASSDVCSDAESCYVNGSSSKTCDRTKKTCNPCLAEIDEDDDWWDTVTSIFSSTEYACYSYSDGECPEDTYDCSAVSSSGSASGSSESDSGSASKSASDSSSTSSSSSGSKKHRGSDSSSDSGSASSSASDSDSASGSNSNSNSNSSSSSSSGSNSTTVTPTPTPTPTPTTTAEATAASSAASSGSANTSSETDSSSGASVGLIVGIVAAVVIVAVAVIGFILWKKRRDEDDDSDEDDDRRLDPPKTEFSRPAPPPAAVSTAYSSKQYPYQANARLPAPQVPITSVTSPVGGAATINYSLPSSPDSEAAAKPSATAGGGSAAFAGRQGSYHFSDRGSDRGSDNEQDVWGNQAGGYREKRTHSNVSVEF